MLNLGTRVFYHPDYVTKSFLASSFTPNPNFSQSRVHLKKARIHVIESHPVRIFPDKSTKRGEKHENSVAMGCARPFLTSLLLKTTYTSRFNK